MTAMHYFFEGIMWLGVFTFSLWLTACLVGVVLFGWVKWNERNHK